MRLDKIMVIAVLITSLMSPGCGPKTYHNLAVASDSMAHGLKNVQDALTLGVTTGAVTVQERDGLQEYIVKAATYGINLDKAVRGASVSGASVQVQIDAFLNQLNALNTQVLGLRDARTRLAISGAITSIETAVAVMSANQGSKK